VVAPFSLASVAPPGDQRAVLWCGVVEALGAAPIASGFVVCPLEKLGQHGVLLRVFSELRKRLLERHFSPAGIKPSLADYLSQSLSNDPDIERRIPRKRAPAIAGIPDLT
jgi:hypothetical protein